MAESQPEVPLKPLQKLYHIGGVQVKLPVKPYGPQLIMMGRIIQGLKHRQNCLLESPTGTGKSLALLCSTLAWQREKIETAQVYNSLLDNGVTDPDVLNKVSGFTPLVKWDSEPGTPKEASSTAPPSTPASDPVVSNGGFFYEDDADFKTQPSFSQAMPGEDVAAAMAMEEGMNAQPQIQQQPRKLKVPKIFIGTRTHKQVEQMVKELRRTAYNNVNMVVLSSREHSCIHPTVSNSFNKNEKCRELIDPFKEATCGYYHGTNRMKTHETLANNGGLQGAWDIEDLVRVGHKIKACPYFSARALLETANLVICPYNYLVDPLIRQSMNINLRNHVVILDEAHNIEDFAREAASCIIPQNDLVEGYAHLKERKFDIEECDKLASMLSSLNEWVNDNKDNLTDFTEFGKAGKIYNGTEVIAILDHMGIRSDNYHELEDCLTTVTDQPPMTDSQSHNEEAKPLNVVTKKVLQNILLVFYFLFMDNMKNKDDYYVALLREQVRKKSGQKVDGWFNRKYVHEFEYTINFWCFNPAVAFSPLSALTHSIILTSGTLSPMNSFQSELGVRFKIQMEMRHVIGPNQTFVGTVARGPRGKPLLATFQHTGSWEFQDELGELVLSVCRTVPAGILCFVPSYAILNKLHERWQNTGVWDEICKIKEAMVEQKKGEEFERDMTRFYTTIRNIQMEGASDVNGVFLMAVYRGKVSEGLDFTDDNARAVITVGIPFPNLRDTQVDLKKKYNNSFQVSRKLLSGKEWYEIQAYRAINQALGRCIRHKYDWGALIIVDQRFQGGGVSSGTYKDNKYTCGLSKWVRDRIVPLKNFTETMNCLREFVNNMMTNPPQPPKMDESTNKEKIQSPPTSESNTCPHEATDSTQTVDDEVILIDEATLKSSADDLIENIAQKENTAVSTKEYASNQEESKQRWGSDNCVSSKENDKTFSKSRSKKRPLNVMDYEDLEDFNLTLSPSIQEARQHPNILKKGSEQKKNVLFIDLE